MADTSYELIPTTALRVGTIVYMDRPGEVTGILRLSEATLVNFGHKLFSIPNDEVGRKMWKVLA